MKQGVSGVSGRIIDGATCFVMHWEFVPVKDLRLVESAFRICVMRNNYRLMMKISTMNLCNSCF